ncbi:MAG: IS982 family transposase [Solirubrobacteraceae bacterium]
MDADLDLLLTTVFVTADDLLPERTKNVARRVTDSEVVTLCVAQAIMGIPSDRRFLAVAGKRLAHLFPVLPQQSGYFKRRRRLADSLEWLMGMFASQSPGFHDDLLLIDSTPVECARSRETVKRAGGSCLAGAISDAADYGYCASHSRYFWGMRLHAIFSPDGTPRALELCSPKLGEREVGLVLLDRCTRHGGETLLGDKGYAGREFAQAVSQRDATFVRPRRSDEKGRGPHLAPIRQRIESIFWTCKDILTLERHGARTLQGLRERILARFCCLAAAITLNHQLGRPTRALVNYCA